MEIEIGRRHSTMQRALLLWALLASGFFWPPLWLLAAAMAAWILVSFIRWAW